MPVTQRKNLTIISGSAKLPGDYRQQVSAEQIVAASDRLRKQATLSTGECDALVTGSHEVEKYTRETPPNNLPAGAVAEYRFCKSRQFRMDFAWPEHRVYLEINGGLFGRGKKCPLCGRRAVAGHSSIERLLKDMEKINLASAMGWRPVFCTPQQFSSGEAAKLVERAIGEAK